MPPTARPSAATSAPCYRIWRIRGSWPPEAERRIGAKERTMPDDAVIARDATAPAGRDKLRPPIAILAELTHRCPLMCPYCSNPLELERASAELTTEEWQRI